jgi:hypothetical protein
MRDLHDAVVAGGLHHFIKNASYNQEIIDYLSDQDPEDKNAVLAFCQYLKFSYSVPAEMLTRHKNAHIHLMNYEYDEIYRAFMDMDFGPKRRKEEFSSLYAKCFYVTTCTKETCYTRHKIGFRFEGERCYKRSSMAVVDADFVDEYINIIPHIGIKPIADRVELLKSSHSRYLSFIKKKLDTFAKRLLLFYPEDQKEEFGRLLRVLEIPVRLDLAMHRVMGFMHLETTSFCLGYRVENGIRPSLERVMKDLSTIHCKEDYLKMIKKRNIMCSKMYATMSGVDYIESENREDFLENDIDQLFPSHRADYYSSGHRWCFHISVIMGGSNINPYTNTKFDGDFCLALEKRREMLLDVVVGMDTYSNVSDFWDDLVSGKINRPRFWI